MSKLLYGSHEIRLSDDDDLDTLLNRLKKAVNSGKAEWVEVGGDSHPHRLLVQPGIPILVRVSAPSAYERPGPVLL